MTLAEIRKLSEKSLMDLVSLHYLYPFTFTATAAHDIIELMAQKGHHVGLWRWPPHARSQAANSPWEVWATSLEGKHIRFFGESFPLLIAQAAVFMAVGEA